METKPSIEDQVNAALKSARNVQPSELPYGFSDKVMNRLHAKENDVRPMFTLSPLIRVAAISILILINVFTLRSVLTPQPVQKPAQYATIKDFVNEYQINDSNDEIVTSNTPAHE
jgi:hypothetical protein